jgi:hypothetical protein
MSAPTLTPTDGLDVEYVPDSGAGAPAWQEEQPAEQPQAVVATVELKGQRFRVRDEGVSLLALMKFATIAKRGRTSDDMEGLAALYALLRSCVAGDEWDAFEDHANATGAQGEDLMRVVTDAVQAAAARPTQLPSASPGGRSTTAPSSAVGSSSPGSSIRQGDPGVQQRLERAGRPDLALVVKRAREASTRSSTG